ncbi:MAG TPA: methylated-DNA--[protein]-cysteine S-methyltransferase [Actinomycetota bacterium]|jgi:methylated-DNA-[protein]-cysteine S-methyltransferase
MKAKGLQRLGAGSAARSAALAAELADAAADRGLLDVAVATVESPVGDLLVAVTPRGLVRIAFVEENRDRVLGQLARWISPRILESARATEEVRRELDEYFASGRTVFDLALDRRLMQGMQRDVLSATGRIAYGSVATYGAIAKRIGRPAAARAVGRALGANPIPIVVPCHRVVGANGSLTGYGGGLDRKELLLRLEGALLDA